MSNGLKDIKFEGEFPENVDSGIFDTCSPDLKIHVNGKPYSILECKETFLLKK